MPFTGVSAMDLKREFVALASAEGANLSELCRRFGISRTLAYRLLSRHAVEGESGLGERSRRPRTSPRKASLEIEEAVLAVRARHPTWGGRKIAKVLARGGVMAPSPSTVTQILRRRGIALGGPGHDRDAPGRFEHPHPNDLWQMDFKGYVAMRSGRLHPLTVLDDYSRYAIVLAACANEKRETVKAHLIEAFQRYGLPWRMITDNGPPWGPAAAEGFTKLGVWLIEQDIRVSRSRPFHPQTLGKDERFHRTLKAEALSGPPFADLDEAKVSLERWRIIYNSERPHEALSLETPASRHVVSARGYREQPQPFAYAPDDIMRKVQDGRIGFKARRWRISKAFDGKTIALRPTAVDGFWRVFFRACHIADLDLRTGNDQTQPVTDVPEQPSCFSPV
jgi:transposase InsO family protein